MQKGTYCTSMLYAIVVLLPEKRGNMRRQTAVRACDNKLGNRITSYARLCSQGQAIKATNFTQIKYEMAVNKIFISSIASINKKILITIHKTIVAVTAENTSRAPKLISGKDVTGARSFSVMGKFAAASTY